MNGEPLSNALYILIILLYSLCAVTTFYCLLAGFYLTVNPQFYNIFAFARDHWKRILLTTVPLAALFWFTASYAAVYCKVAYESYSPDSGYYYHKMSLFLPTCGNVGSWSYGTMPPDSMLGLNIGSTVPGTERVILRWTLGVYLLLLSVMNAWVGNYIVHITREKRKNSLQTKES